MDNYATHKVSQVQAWLARHPRYYVHFTPTSGSWLNLVERKFAASGTRGLFENEELRMLSHAHSVFLPKVFLISLIGSLLPLPRQTRCLARLRGIKASILVLIDFEIALKSVGHLARWCVG
jgi:hypothetical protein